MALSIHCWPNYFIYFVRPASLYCEYYAYIYTYIHTYTHTHISLRRDCNWITVATK